MVPPPPKVAKAVAEANRAARRGKPLLLEVTLTIGEGQPTAATGTLVSHPTGLARLELKSHRGFVERHLLQGTAYTASRDGKLIASPATAACNHFPKLFLFIPTAFVPRYCFVLDMVFTHGLGLHAC